MSTKEEFDIFVEELLTRAVEEFKQTEQYELLNEKLNLMECECETMLTKSEQAFVNECFELLLSIDGQQEQYVYRSGLRDCIMILKNLGVL